MKKKVSASLFVVVFIGVVSFTFFSKFIVSSFASLKWHIINESTISTSGFEINLPYNWWVTSNENDQLILSRVPPPRSDYFGNVFLLRKQITENNLRNFKQEKEINGITLRKKGDVSLSKVDNEPAYIIEYLVSDSEKHAGRIYWTWSIPSKNFVINAAYIYSNHKSYILSEIIGNIKFKSPKG